jgi:UDP-glucose 4-epimerase
MERNHWLEVKKIFGENLMGKILITGNSGYIGSHLSQILKKDSKLEIHGLDKNDPMVSLDKFHKQNIVDDTNWNIDEEYDCVVHLAAEVAVGRSVITPTLYYQTNTIGTLNVLKKIKTKRLVIASTGAAAGLGSPYGISKRAMEDVVFEYCKDNNIPFTIFRFYNVTGSDGIEPTNPDGLFASLIAATRTGKFTIFGDDYNTKDGTCVRDYTHVNEICHAVIQGISKSTDQIENLGHGVGTTVKEMVELFKEVNNSNFEVTVGPRREGDLEISVLSNPSKFMKKMYNIKELLKI